MPGRSYAAHISVDVAAGTAWATSRTNENMRRQPLEPSQSFTAVIPPKLNSSQLRTGMPGAKTGMTHVAGHFCSHIRRVFQAVPAAMSQDVHWQHMGIRL